MVNPVVTQVSRETEVDDEGCLSLRDVLVPGGAGRLRDDRRRRRERRAREVRARSSGVARRPARARPPGRRPHHRPHERRGAARGAREAPAAAGPRRALSSSRNRGRCHGAVRRRRAGAPRRPARRRHASHAARCALGQGPQARAVAGEARRRAAGNTGAGAGAARCRASTSARPSSSPSRTA